MGFVHVAFGRPVYVASVCLAFVELLTEVASELPQNWLINCIQFYRGATIDRRSLVQLSIHVVLHSFGWKFGGVKLIWSAVERNLNCACYLLDVIILHLDL